MDLPPGLEEQVQGRAGEELVWGYADKGLVQAHAGDELVCAQTSVSRFVHSAIERG